MAGVKFKDLLGTGAHFGHVTRKWHPNYKPYILMEKNGVHIINLEETVRAINKATNFIKDVIKKNGEILFVGTKKQARDIVQEEADRCRMFYIVERWLGGTLTNFSTIKKSIKRLRLLEKEGSSLYSNTITKKETQMLNRERIKLADQHRGIKDMRRLPDAIVVVDANYEETAIREAKSLDIPIVAIVDTNSDPVRIDYPIPANDDSIRTIQLIISAISEKIIQAKGFGKDELDSKGELSAPVDGSTKPVVKETVEASKGESYVKNIENSTEENAIEEEE
ncbi:MAG: 30S ribosomal protein S2 [Candidatus Neomarinimicrobiota bacterium]|jgi:small subunit ribosomal protein S2|nr:30S ribosomal protein S2 [Candidatus Neomarinimicrobiota bacterium]